MLLLLGSPLLEPFRISLNTIQRNLLTYATLISIILPLFELFLIHLLVKPMHLSHFLDLEEIHHEAPLICMILLDALSTENGQMVRAVKVLHSLVMLITQEALCTIFILEVYVS